MAKEKPHHHGDLQNALITAGIEILDRDGLEGLSLRKVAAAVGVSHAAPAHHYQNKTGLMLAIAANGFRTFTALMIEERQKAGPDPQKRLEGICAGYLRFSREHPALFQLIFSTDIQDIKNDDLRQAAQGAFDVLHETCSAFLPSPNGPMVNEIMIWSLVHGFATLTQSNNIDAPPDVPPISFNMLLPKLTPR